jgi:hypothetical protein
MTRRFRVTAVVLGFLCATVWVVAVRAVWATRSLGETRTFGDLFGLGGMTSDGRNLNWFLLPLGLERRSLWLVRHGPPAAQLYGACGLYLAGSPLYEREAQRLSRDETKIWHRMGCLGFDTAVKDLATQMPRMCRGLRAPLRLWALGELGALL